MNGYSKQTKDNINQALSIGREIKNDNIVYVTIAALGSFCVQEGDLNGAKEYYEKALVLAKKMDNVKNISVSYGDLGYVYQLIEEDKLFLLLVSHLSLKN